MLNEFMERCNQVFGRRNITCPGCDSLVEVTEDQALFPLSGKFYGIQAFTCYTCLKHFCYNCEDNNGKSILKNCDFCDRDYCRECAQMEECGECSRDFCKKCISIEKCSGCHLTIQYTHNYCKECKSMTKCGDCGNCYCGDCDVSHECIFD